VIVRKSGQEIEKMAAAGEVVAETIALVGEQIRPGMTTAELDQIGEEHIRSRGGTPTSKGYRGFPAALCISPNSMVVHGNPGPYRLEEGDVVSVDIGVTHDGFVADTLALIGENVRAGVTTGELDALAEEFITAQGGYPTFKGYRGYPASICSSPNEVVVHGIPGPYALAEGDILSVDVGVTLGGFVGDSAHTFPVGEISEEAERLLETCQAALVAGIEQARVGNRVGDISAAVLLATEEGRFAVVRSLVGHGVGRSYHEDPQIPNFGPAGRGPLLAEGMTIAIEPMITAGRPDVYVHDDEWSISTVDGSLAAHFEHTVAVTESGPRILTVSKVPLLR
jgi:methionyl aminopeptidase